MKSPKLVDAKPGAPGGPGVLGDPRTTWALEPGSELGLRQKLSWYRGNLNVVVRKPKNKSLGINFKMNNGKWLVFQVDPSGCAVRGTQGGLLPGDELVELDGKPFGQEQADFLAGAKQESAMMTFVVRRMVPVEEKESAPLPPEELPSQVHVPSLMDLLFFACQPVNHGPERSENVEVVEPSRPGLAAEEIAELKAVLKEELRAEVQAEILDQLRKERAEEEEAAQAFDFVPKHLRGEAEALPKPRIEPVAQRPPDSARSSPETESATALSTPRENETATGQDKAEKVGKKSWFGRSGKSSRKGKA